MGSQGQIVELESGWATVQDEAIIPLINLLESSFDRATKPFTNKKYMEVYRVCYLMCTQRSPNNYSETLYDRHENMFKEYLCKKVLPPMEQASGVPLLKELRTRWANHIIMNKWMFRFLRYLDKYYVEHYNKLKLLDAGNMAFRTHVFDKVKGRVTAAIIGEINRSREGEQIEVDLIKHLVGMYEKMGEGTLQIYDVELQKPLVSATSVYYTQKAAQWMAQMDVPTYLDKAESVLKAESERVKVMLLPSTESELIDTVANVLLKERQSALLNNETSGLARLLAQEKKDDLARMYRLFSRVGQEQRCLDPIADGFGAHFRDVGKGIVQDRVKNASGEAEGAGSAGGAGAGAGAAGEAKKPKGEVVDQPEFVKSLVTLHEKAKELVLEQFGNHTRFQKSLKDAFEVFMNHMPEGTKYSNSELTAAYADRVLSGKGEKLDENALDTELERIVQLFAFINDKDVFADEYRKFMGKRLLGQKSVSTDAERTMIGKLKVRCGTGFTSRMEGMLNDLSKAEMEDSEFKAKMAGKTLPLDFGIQVLTTVNWPSMTQVQVNLPPSMEACRKMFQEHYETTRSKKKLTWNWSQGNAVVTAKFGQVYEFNLTTLQTIVLHAFNDVSEPIGYETLRDKLGMGKDDDTALKAVMHSFSCVKHKVLLKTPENSKIDNGDKFAVNAGFSDKMRRLRIPIATLEPKSDKNKVEDDRGYAIEAAIVRIMKARKTLGHAQLISEVIAQLQFFKPNPKDIKRRIETLIDREYLERGADPAKNEYTYLA